MKIKQANQILNEEMAADCRVGLGTRHAKASVEAAQNMADYAADKAYNSAEGRIWRAQQKKKAAKS